VPSNRRSTASDGSAAFAKPGPRSFDTRKCQERERPGMSLLTGIGVVVIVAIHTAVAVVLTRFFRLQLATRWAAAIYTVVLVPLALLVSAAILSGALGLGGSIGGRDVVLLLVIVLPLSLGIAIDVFWMPSPEEIELPGEPSES
jgi:hypothetical protein